MPIIDETWIFPLYDVDNRGLVAVVKHSYTITHVGGSSALSGEKKTRTVYG